MSVEWKTTRTLAEKKASSCYLELLECYLRRKKNIETSYTNSDGLNSITADLYKDGFSTK